NPKVNQELEEIADVNEKIKNLEQHEERYKTLINEQSKTEESLNAKKNALHQLETIRKQKMKEVMYHSDIKAWKSLEDRLNIERRVCAEQGVERYEGMKNQRQQNQREIGLREEKLRSLKNELSLIDLPEKEHLACLERIQKREPDIK